MKTTTLAYYLLMGSFFFVACGRDTGEKTATEQTTSTSKQVESTIEEQQTNNASIASTYLSDESWKATLAIKSAFDEGLAVGYDKRTMAYIYQQHALRLKLDVLKEESFAHLYPYNGAFKLEDHQKWVDKLSYITYKCGFQAAEKGKTVHYYCLSLEGGFLDFLTKLGERNQLIESFASSYREKKSLDRNIYQGILIGAESKLNFENLDHQIFYSFVHILTQEEVLASKRFVEIQ